MEALHPDQRRLLRREGRELIEDVRQLTIGEVAALAGMPASRIRYYEARDILPEPHRVSGKRRYSQDVVRRLAIIAAAQRVGFTLDEIRDLFDSRDRPAHERLRRLALNKLPEIDGLIKHATAIRDLLQTCSTCDCESIDVCALFDDRSSQLRTCPADTAAPRLVVFPGGGPELRSPGRPGSTARSR